MKIFREIVLFSVVFLVASAAPNEVDLAPEDPNVPYSTTGELNDDVEHVNAAAADNIIATDGYSLFPGQFAYHAEVGVKVKQYTGFFKRSGALITPNYVLMQAHFLGQNVFDYEFDYGEIGLGAVFNGSVQWEQRIRFSVNGILFHPLYRHKSDWNTILNNIALIHMERPATLSRYVQPIRLPLLSDQRTYEMMEGTAVGASDTIIPTYARNQVMPNAQCLSGFPTDYAEQHLCTNSYVGGSFCNLQQSSSLAIEDETGQRLVGIATYVYGFLVGLVASVEDTSSEQEIGLRYVYPEQSARVDQTPKSKYDNRLATDGYVAFPGQFPYYARIELAIIYTRLYFQVCAGALITPNYVLSTKYCLSVSDREQLQYGVAGLAFGEWEQLVNFTTSGINVHPYVLPIRLPRTSDTRTYVEMEATSGGPRYVRNMVMANDDCNQEHPYQYFSDEHVCTDAYIGGAFCGRLYGSPLAIEDESGMVLIGLANAIYWCEVNYPTRYTRVANFRDWIQDNSNYLFDC
uniref:Peptidase S1 domain-containing protein n=1 Tax=Anopheles epiroticus TaxID=199890 RepID=A0A182PHI1_9DIPT